MLLKIADFAFHHVKHVCIILELLQATLNISNNDIILELDARIHQVVDQSYEMVLLWISINLYLSKSPQVIAVEFVVEVQVSLLLFLLGLELSELSFLFEDGIVNNIHELKPCLEVVNLTQLVEEVLEDLYYKLGGVQVFIWD